MASSKIIIKTDDSGLFRHQLNIWQSIIFLSP